LQGAEVGVVAAVLEDGQEFAGLIRSCDQGVGFGGGSGEGLFNHDCAMVSAVFLVRLEWI